MMMSTSGTIQTATEIATTPQDLQSDGVSLSDELRGLKDQLRHCQKLAGLGTTAAMLAHEYNNMFAPIVSYAQFALDKNDIQLMRKTLNMMLAQHEAVQAMSDRILGFARHAAPERQAVPLKEVVENAAACLGRDLGKDGIALAIDIDSALAVQGDRNQLQQVFFNLLLNARQALVERGGRIKISATQISANKVTVHFRDNGPGIADADLQQIFQPFFSTKATSGPADRRGGGLGLAICKDIIEEHGGIIAAESIKDHGTTFTITLPCPSQEN